MEGVERDWLDLDDGAEGLGCDAWHPWDWESDGDDERREVGREESVVLAWVVAAGQAESSEVRAGRGDDVGWAAKVVVAGWRVALP